MNQIPERCQLNTLNEIGEHVDVSKNIKYYEHEYYSE